MNPVAISSIIFVCIFGASLLGLFLRATLPENHLNPQSQDIVKLGMGLVGTMTALLLGLLVASAKSSYDTQKSELTQMSANVILLDRVLAHYGPESKGARNILRGSVVATLNRIWPSDGAQAPNSAPSRGGEILYDKIQELVPHNEAQRSLQTQALTMTINLGQMRWLLFEQGGSSLSSPFLVILVFWLSMIFLSFGLFAPRNLTVIATLLVCALSVSSALFLLMELDQPLHGLVQIPSAPMRHVLELLGQ